MHRVRVRIRVLLGIGLGFPSGQSQCVLPFRSVNYHIIVKSGTRCSRSVLEIIPTRQQCWVSYFLKVISYSY